MFSHICLGTNNLAEFIAFYDHVMPVLTVTRQDSGTPMLVTAKEDIGSGINWMLIGSTFNGEPASAGNGVNIAFLAQTRDQVTQFHSISTCKWRQRCGSPGLRDVHPNFFAAYVLDPTGNKLVVVCHAPE